MHVANNDDMVCIYVYIYSYVYIYIYMYIILEQTTICKPFLDSVQTACR